MRVSASLAALAAAALLAGCATEAGLHERGVSFGDAYNTNLLIQSAEYQRGEFLAEAKADFAANVPDTVTFAFDRAGLDSAARQALTRQAAWLRANPLARVRITGHTDLVGGEAYNDRLGLRRARAASRYLQRRGVARGRIDLVESRGEREPVVQTEEKERRNRRALTEVAGFTHGFVGDGMDGRRALLMFRRYVSDTVETPAEITVTSGSGAGGE
ncbi:MAG: OmpA family protein [Pseudomonadota bacterium]